MESWSCKWEAFNWIATNFVYPKVELIQPTRYPLNAEYACSLQDLNICRATKNVEWLSLNQVIIFWEQHGYGVIASLSQWVTRVAAMGDIKKLCIIGAGFAGLTAARVFKALNYDITLYEKDA